MSVATASLVVAAWALQVSAEEATNTVEVTDELKSASIDARVNLVDDLGYLDNKEESNTELSKVVSVKVAEALGYEVDDEEKYCLIFGEELASYGMVLKSDKTEEELHEYSANIQPISVLKTADHKVVDMNTKEGQKEKLNVNADRIAEKERIAQEEAEKARKTEEARKKAEAEAKAKAEAERKAKKARYEHVNQSEALLEIDCPDENYTGTKVYLDPADRDLLERLVMGEAGDEGYEGACLVAQAIRDAIVYRGFNSVAEVRSGLKYSGSIKREPNKDVLNAVKFIFDEGGMAVKHRVYYFYAFKMTKSSWHESQEFIIQHNGHRFFDSRK